MSISEDARLALSLQRELNGLGRRGRAKAPAAAEPGAARSASLSSARKESSKHASSHNATKRPRGDHEAAAKGTKVLKKQRVASRPMVYHETLGLWYRAQVTHRRPNEVRVAWDGKDDWKPEWLSCGSARIWKGSMRNKDWKYVSNGGWLPKTTDKGASPRGPQDPATPPLVSPHNSGSETEMSEDLRDLEETAQRIEWDSPAKAPAAKVVKVKEEEAGRPDQGQPSLKIKVVRKVEKATTTTMTTKKKKNKKQKNALLSFAKIKAQSGGALPIKLLLKMDFKVSRT
ncbi:hypothetical protein HOP50_03g26250 [Chloropicon primus]|uniref:Uncharacterized protein n=1 Tax=Chloropicon primus TaxID=1764295 RepID=A0A5B8MI08_9CHLO|nr:hypothetical protein A3770_03p26240 [Chloropicon primus]UPQ99318.1 hypothetical protein HOP50_03g26250 [Chloropicon primus]|mmetsp:Transcript_4859/g.14517  ORF Transcript_4859/g.14517 Transcript_4859/m.14517 type:complete len:287 (-) Transcript_4859:3711-4571(-)|eukprot:QDZ20106.1 hypothetical protein A3770_03p26240 [Chloropicon primus]